MNAEFDTIEAGQAYVPAGAVWVTDLRTGLAQFSNGRFDDQVGSTSLLLIWATTHRARSVTFARIG